MSGHDHDHGHSHAPTGDGPSHKRRLAIVLALTASYLVIEAIGSYLTGSLALLAEAGHMLADAGGLALALFAITLAEKKATSARTYGYYRAEILAAMMNGIVLFGLSAFVLYETVGRLMHPPEVQSHAMVLIAVAGLAINGTGILVLRGAATKSLNVKAAYFEVVSDAATALGVIVAGVIMWTTRWYYADPIISAGIGLFILPRTYTLVREAVGVLLEGTPANVNLASLREAIGSVQGVKAVHDLHVWSLTSGMNAMSVHVLIAEGGGHDDVLERVQHHVKKGFEIQHVTVQVESRCVADEVHL